MSFIFLQPKDTVEYIDPRTLEAVSNYILISFVKRIKLVTCSTSKFGILMIFDRSEIGLI